MVQIFEYRVVMPLLLEEYRIAQMYMVTKIQEQQTAGGEGVEVLANKPFEDEEYGQGQYTSKIYHLQSKIPSWLSTFVATKYMYIEEEAWNAYPKCKTVLKCPYLSRFKLTIETIHVADNGNSPNVHNLNKEALAARKVENLDIGLNARDYWSYVVGAGGPELDLSTFQSEKTGRGPLTPGWQNSCNPVMTAYKLVTVDVPYWGFGYRLEQALLGAERSLFTESHKRCFHWIDEWFGLTYEDVRRMEMENDKSLNQKLGKLAMAADSTESDSSSSEPVKKDASLPSSVSNRHQNGDAHAIQLCVECKKRCYSRWSRGVTRRLSVKFGRWSHPRLSRSVMKKRPVCCSSLMEPLHYCLQHTDTLIATVIAPAIKGSSDTLKLLNMDVGMQALIATVATGSTVVTVATRTRRGADVAFEEGRDLPLRYDADLIAAYFKKRPVDIVKRSAKIMFECSSLTFNILWDKYVGRDREMETLRARQLVELITRLGPTAVKIGQALSIRPDILPQVYLDELQKLQDRVPPFSNEQAKQIILESLGLPAEDIFDEMSEHPIAAASLGQVYKAKLRETGVPVAVKVQRPGVLEGISRDLFLLRIGCWLFEQVPMVQSDMVGLLDTWAFRFFDELDYVQEAHNGIQFLENMKSLPNVTVPEMFLSYTSRKVLTSAWVVGEKLSESDPADLLPLITTAMNCYLVQLLESGFLHADPHPGNLLKTPDGRLCVLDFGLMTQVTEEQRYTLIEYIAHLMNSDYPRVADDLVRLGFVPADRADPEKTAAAVPQLTRVMSQLIQGGGVRNLNVQQMTDDITKISKDYIFVIPPYFALILRAFSVLEGIGLDVDPDYSIVSACYPYLSKRLLTDDSPRTRAALKYCLYGDGMQLDIQRVEALASGFQSFRDIMATSHAPVVPAKVNYVDPTTKEALKLLFAPEGSYIQELILIEVVRAVDALSREALAELWQFFSQRVNLPSTMAIPGSWPLPNFVLFGILGGKQQMARLSPDDYKSLDLVRRLWILVEPHLMRPSATTEFAEIAQDIAPVMVDLLPGVRTVAQRFAIMLFQRQTLRLADDLDGRQSVRSWDHDPAAFARRVIQLPPPKQLQQLGGRFN